MVLVRVGGQSIHVGRPGVAFSAHRSDGSNPSPLPWTACPWRGPADQDPRGVLIDHL